MVYRQLKRILKRSSFYRHLKKRQFDRLCRLGFPPEIQAAVSFLLTGDLDETVVAVQSKIEGVRKDMQNRKGNSAEIIYSPLPGSAGTSLKDVVMPAPGESKIFSYEEIAKTGKSPRWGCALHLVVRSAGTRFGVELGTCAGLSAAYLSLAPSMEMLITVEGSTQLAEIASSNLSKLNAPAQVVNALFSDAIDAFGSQHLPKFDFAYIDGHHEKIATLHYFEKLKPHLNRNALVLFDDISWSYDMREAWELLKQVKEFDYTIDLGEIGICRIGDKRRDALHWDLRELLDLKFLNKPRGWEGQKSMDSGLATE